MQEVPEFKTGNGWDGLNRLAFGHSTLGDPAHGIQRLRIALVVVAVKYAKDLLEIVILPQLFAGLPDNANWRGAAIGDDCHPCRPETQLGNQHPKISGFGL